MKAQTLEWAYDFTGSDEQASVSVAINDDGEIFIAGYYSSASIDFNEDDVADVVNTGPSPTYDGFVAKFDNAGNFINAINIGGSDDNEIVYSITLDNSGDPIVVGTTSSLNLDLDPAVAGNEQTGTGEDGFIIYYNADLTYNTSRLYTSVYIYDVTVDGGGNIYTTGFFYGANVDLGGQILSSFSDSHDAFLARYNTSLTANWAIPIGGDFEDSGEAIHFDPISGHLYVAGYFSDSASFNNDAIMDIPPSNGGTDVFVAKYTTGSISLPGDFLWFNVAGGINNDYLKDVTTDPFQNVFICGNFDTSMDTNYDDIDDLFSVGDSGFDAFIIKYSADGTSVLNATNYGTSDYESGNAIVSDANGELYMTGDYGNGMFLSKFTGSASLSGERTFVNDGLEYAQDLDLDPNGDVVFTGYFTSSGIDLNNDATNDLTLQGVTDMFLIKFLTTEPPMSGTYTIGTTAPVDYTTFNGAIQDLIDRGIDGDVFFDVQDGTYSEQISIPEISGTLDGFAIEFRSISGDNSTVSVTYGASSSTANYTLQMNGAKNIKFRNISFEATNAGFGTAVEFLPTCQNIRFEFCRFRGVIPDITSSDHALVRRDYNGTAYDSEIYFESGAFVNGSYGIYYEECIDLHIYNNTFSNQNASGIELYFNPRPIILDNRISSSSSTFLDGIYIESGYDLNGTYGAPIIERNKISMPGPDFSSGIYISDYFPETGAMELVNNFIHINTTGADQSGLYLGGVKNANIYHNSINITGTSLSSEAIYVENAELTNLTNNIFANQATGVALHIGPGNLNLTSNYNNLYSNGTVLVEDTTATYPELASWKETANDLNSISVVPQFVSNSDLHTDNSSLSAGTPIPSVTIDIDYDPRDPNTPSIGADEVASLASDSLTLVVLYDSLNGENWTNKTNWLTGTVDTWYGVSVWDNRVKSVDLANNNLTGTIPPSVGNLSALEQFVILEDSVTGAIPQEIWSISSLNRLVIRHTQVSGTLPPEIGNLINLQSLDIAFNNLSGAIPQEIGNLTNMEFLTLDFNQFEGEIPATIGNMSLLKQLYVGENRLSGAVPVEIASLDSLELFNMFVNQLTSLPDFSGLTNLLAFEVDNNNFTFEDLEPNVGISGFKYAPQKLVGTESYDTLTTGSPINLSVSVGGSSNLYQWFLNGDTIPGATSGVYILDSLTEADFGDYILKVSSTIVPDLILESYPFHIINRADLQLPDYAIQSFSYSPDQVSSQSTFQADVNVINQGNVANQVSFQVSLYLSADRALNTNTDPEIGIITVDQLGANTSTTLTFDNLSVPSGFEVGDFYLITKADALDEDTEIDETNNLADLAISIIDSESNKPVIGIPDYPQTHDPTSGTATISVDVTDDSGINEVRFVYKEILEPPSDWDFDIMTFNNTSYEVTVDQSYYDEMGLMFVIIASDIYGNRDTTDIYYSRRDLGESASITGLPTGSTINSYRIIAIPFDMSPTSVSAVFADDFGGSFDKEVWRLVGFNGSSYSDLGASSSIQRGTGYWFINTSTSTITLPASTSPNYTPDNPFSISLRQGWNLIGNPYPFTINWNTVQSENSTDIGALNVWNGSGYSQPTNLSLFQGAFVFMESAGSVVFPLQEANARIAESSRYEDFGHSIDNDPWLVELELESDNLRNTLGGIGMHPKAASGLDKFDNLTVPPFIEYLDLNHSGERYSGSSLSRNIVPVSNSHQWDFEVNTSVNNERIRLSWNNDSFKDDNSYLQLLDLKNGVRIDMKSDNHYEFQASESIPFKILYSTDPIMANRLVLDPYPNPFLNMLRIPVQVPDELDGASYSVSVYSLTGNKIRALSKGILSKGYHEIVWDGRNDLQRDVAQGIYIVQLETQGVENKPLIQYKKIIKN